MLERLQRLATLTYRTAWLLVIPLLLSVQMPALTFALAGSVFLLACCGTLLCMMMDVI